MKKIFKELSMVTIIIVGFLLLVFGINKTFAGYTPSTSLNVYGSTTSNEIASVVFSCTIPTNILKNSYYTSTNLPFPYGVSMTDGTSNALAYLSNNLSIAYDGNNQPYISLSSDPQLNNYFVALNTQTVAVNMNNGYGDYSTAATFTLTAPINVNMSQYSISILLVTNSSGSPIQANAPATWHTNVISPWTVTNVASIQITIDPGKWTNAIFQSLW